MNFRNRTLFLNNIIKVTSLTLFEILVLGEAGVWGLEGGVIGLWNLSPSCFPLDAGDPILLGWLMKSILSIPTGEGGLSSSAVDLRRV